MNHSEGNIKYVRIKFARFILMFLLYLLQNKTHGRANIFK